MLMFLGRRLAWMAFTLWIVYTVSFFLQEAVPGNPLTGEKQVSPAIMKNLEAKYNLNATPFERYLSALGSALVFDFGPSFVLEDYSVNEVIAQGFPVSASLGIFALIFAVTLGLTAGVLSAVNRGRGVDVLLMSAATLGMAVPNFVMAALLIIVFVFLIPLLPAAGWGSPEQLILPAFCLGLPYAAYIARLTRTGMLDVLGQDYIRTARAKGLSIRTIITGHAMKGALLPVASFLGPAVAGILTGSLVVEKIFAIPGLGSHFIKAVEQSDYNLALGMVVIYTLMFYLMNLLVDLSYSYLDPRVKME